MRFMKTISEESDIPLLRSTLEDKGFKTEYLPGEGDEDEEPVIDSLIRHAAHQSAKKRRERANEARKLFEQLRDFAIGELAEAIRAEHRTLQQKDVGMFLSAFREWARITGVDGRNKAAVRWATENLEDFRGFPLI